MVTATREPRDSLITPASVSRIGGDALAALSAKHQADALNRSAGVYVQRGSGAESLARHPLAGADRRGRLRRIPRGRGQPAHPPGGILQSQRDVRAQLRAGRRHRSAARPGLGHVRRERRARHRQRAHAARRRPGPRFRGCRGRLGLLQTPAARLRAAVRRLGPRRLWRSARARPAGATPRASTRPSSIYSRMARSAGGTLRLRAAGRYSTRTPRVSSRATTLIETKTSRAAIRIPRLSATLRARESRRISSATTASRSTAASNWRASTAARAWISSSTS